MRKTALSACLAVLALAFGGCTFHSKATIWHERVGPDGERVYFTSMTKVGFNLLIIVPFIGQTDIETMVDELTAEIAELDGNHIRIVQGDTENYWYGWSPLTWIVTPVVSSLTAEYRPSAREIEIEDQNDAEKLGAFGM
ncbi:MAG: hypothetical protein IPM29_13380 [Planctomycetes bacterium]|nr:hypothetical protein [Planctomycetota bacterium]